MRGTLEKPAAAAETENFPGAFQPFRGHGIQTNHQPSNSPMQTLSSQDMSLLRGGFAPLMPDPFLPEFAIQTRDIMRYLRDQAMRTLLTNRIGIVD